MKLKNAVDFGICMLCSFIFLSSLSVWAGVDVSVTPEYQFDLYMARGKLSVSESYYETAIQNFYKALDIRVESSHVRDWLEKAVTLKKLGVLNEAAESG
ncbi:hypothetical protein JXL19_12420 [bacterium]|nr:hypothetical protein [bacterium]